MSLSRRRMMYSLAGLAGMTRNFTALHAHHHAPRFGKRALEASLAASGSMADKAPGVSGQGDMKFKVLYTSDHLPPEAQKALVNAHGGFAVDRRPGHDEAYFALPGAGILQISSDFKTINLLNTPDEMRKVNLHDTNIWYDKEGTPYLVFPANSEGKIFTTMIKEDLGLPNFLHIHNAALRKIGSKFYILALAWNPGDFAILEQA